MSPECVRSPAIHMLVILFAALLPGPAHPAPVEVVSTTQSVAVDLGAQTAAANEVIREFTGGLAVLEALGGLPPTVEVTAVDLEQGASSYFAVDTAVELGGVILLPGDVIEYDGVDYSPYFVSSDADLPVNARIDGLAFLDNGDLLVSYDIAVDLSSGVYAEDEDVIRFPFAGGPATIAFDGAANGLPVELDTDGLADLGGGRLGLSFDTSGQIGALYFDDEDIIMWDPNDETFTMYWDADAHLPLPPGADTQAVSVPEPAWMISWGAGLAALVALSRRRRRRTIRSAAALASIVAFVQIVSAGFALDAGAADGQIEINHASVIAAGGYPYTITTSGSYRLTGNLAPTGGASAISVSASEVSIDLGGFSIVGPGSCLAQASNDKFFAINCNGNAGTGILSGSGLSEVKNGTIRGFEFGIFAAGAAVRLDNLVVRENSATGAVVSGGSLITESTFEANDGRGVDVSNGQIRVRDSRFRLNRLFGLDFNGGVVRGSTFEFNGNAGLYIFGGPSAGTRGAIVTDCSFHGEAEGIDAPARVGFRSSSFTTNTTNYAGGATNLGDNVCDGVVCP